MVETPSVSGGEAALVGFLAGQMRHWDLEPIVSGRNVWCRVDGRRGDGPTLLLNAHIDTVPPSEAWTVDPWRARRFDGKLQGLGSNDTKGGGAAMLCAVADLARERDFAGTLLYAATCDEETGGEGMEVLRDELPPLDAAVICEPTTLRVATAQRGLMRVVVRCDGRSAHASRPWQGKNAIEVALRDIAAVLAIPATEEHATLGRATIVPTLIEGGVRPNVVPPVCRFTLDVRPIPQHPNDWWAAQIEAAVEGEIEVMKKRYVPVETADSEPIVQAALAATDTQDTTSLGGVSDLFFVRDIPAIVLGPGLSTQSHQADEWVEESQVQHAKQVYTDLVQRYLG
jgi:acetylornithine deacetylase/succinyl-diaminopimelate desuccinylase-like protein